MEVDIQNCIFDKGLSLYLASVPKIQIEGSTIKGVANFHSLNSSQFWLNKTRFYGPAVFVAGKFGFINLADAQFYHMVDFSGATIKEEMNTIRLWSEKPIRIGWDQFGKNSLKEFVSWATAVGPDNRISRLDQVINWLLFWQKNFENLGNKKDLYQVEKERIYLKRQYYISPTDLEWWLSVLLEIPNGYGTSPLRPIWIGLVMIILFGLIYYIKKPFIQDTSASHIKSKQPLLIFSLLFSLETFTPFFKVTGVKEWGWVLKDSFRYVELVERLVGLLIFVLATYSVGQSYF